MARLSEATKAEIIVRLVHGDAVAEIAVRLGVGKTTVYEVRSGLIRLLRQLEKERPTGDESPAGRQ